MSRSEALAVGDSEAAEPAVPTTPAVEDLRLGVAYSAEPGPGCVGVPGSPGLSDGSRVVTTILLCIFAGDLKVVLEADKEAGEFGDADRATCVPCAVVAVGIWW
mmetsp:Transcript_15178/g.45503  ORF Transcript_15178/g.45503 Transcript_15178/m.45503 type:complete len:104 (-) Transcript_15178:425-736(-)